MSGIAIAIPGADFSGKNLGKVTFLEDVDVTGIAIVTNDSYEGQTAQLSIAYTPATTNQKGVIWSISTGSTYATIDASTGKLTILEGANNSSVTVKAVSTFNGEITATKSINVTYKETVDELTGISIVGDDTVGLSWAQFSIDYNPSNTSKVGVTWSITAGSQYASINQDGVLSASLAGSVTIKAVSTYDSSIVATKTITITDVMPYIFLNINEDEKGVLTDIVIPNISVAEMEILCMVRALGNVAIGSRTSSSANDRLGLLPSIYQKYGYWNAIFGSGTLEDVDTPQSLTKEANLFVINKDSASINGTALQYTSTPDVSGANTAPFAIGNFYNNGTKSWQFVRNGGGSIRIAYIKIKENGVVTHNLQPYNSGNDFGFKDTVTGKTYSAAELTAANYGENFYAL